MYVKCQYKILNGYSARIQNLWKPRRQPVSVLYRWISCYINPAPSPSSMRKQTDIRGHILRGWTQKSAGLKSTPQIVVQISSIKSLLKIHKPTITGRIFLFSQINHHSIYSHLFLSCQTSALLSKKAGGELRIGKTCFWKESHQMEMAFTVNVNEWN